MQPQILVNFGYGGRTMILADKIIEERKKNGWTQEDLAQKLGVSLSLIHISEPTRLEC